MLMLSIAALSVALNSDLIDASGETIGQARQVRIVLCQSAVREKLDDPYSAKLPNLEKESYKFVISEVGNETAEVFMLRAKNRMGAYQKMTARCSFRDGRLAEALIM